MRYVDIYTGDGVLVAADCRQLGGTDKPAQKRTPNAKRFTMANGDPLVYPAQKDTMTCTVELECGYAQALAISRKVRLTRMLFSGLSLGCTAPQTLPETSGIAGIITGGVDVCEKYSGTGIYGVTIPLQIELDNDGMPAQTNVPAVTLSGGILTLDGMAESLRSDYIYTKGGYFLRKTPYIAGSDSDSIGFTMSYSGTGSPSFWLLRGEAGITASATSAYPQELVVDGPAVPSSGAVSLNIQTDGQTEDIELYTIRQTTANRECKIVIPVYSKG